MVVPAHQEAGRIERCLAALAEDWCPGELDVVVVSNGSTDGTAARARSAARELGLDVRVLDLPAPGKAGALRAGEHLTTAPRLYLDADVVCPTPTVRALLRAVAPDGGHGSVDVAVPTRRLDLGRCSPPAALYHRAWERLPWVQEQLSGRGAYALSPEAAETFAGREAVLADDRLATSSAPADRTVVVPQEAWVSPAPTIRDLLAVRRRIYAGNTQLETQLGVPRHDRSTVDRVRALARVAARPSGWPGLVLWAGVTTVAKLAARRRGPVVWRRARGAQPGAAGALTGPAALDVVVVTYRSAGTVGACLDSVAAEAARTRLDVRTVVVDNASDDTTLAVVGRAGLPVTVLPRSANDGFGRACARGASVGTAPFLLFCNPDVELLPGALDALVAEAADPAVGVVGGRQVDATGADGVRSWWRRPSWWSALCFCLGLSSRFPRSRVFDPEEGGRWDGSSQDVDAVSGGLMLVRRALWEELGGFDRDMLLYGEDIDLCLRARRRGLRVRVSGAALYRHQVGTSTGAGTDPAGRAVRLQLVLRGRAEVLRRHLGTAAVVLLVAGVGLRALAAPTAPGGRATTGRDAWRRAWAGRRTWSQGWPAGADLQAVVADAVLQAAPPHQR